jgi:hypothetical protein
MSSRDVEELAHVERLLGRLNLPVSSLTHPEPPKPDARALLADGRCIAVEVTDVEARPELKGRDNLRGVEVRMHEADPKAYVLWTGDGDPGPPVLAAIERKASKTYDLGDAVEVWLLLVSNYVDEGRTSTTLYPQLANWPKLNAATALAACHFSRIYWAPRTPAGLYQWKPAEGWTTIQEARHFEDASPILQMLRSTRGPGR